MLKMTSYMLNRPQSTGANWVLGLGSAVVFAVSVTNCVVYSNGSSGSGSGSSGSGGGTTAIDPTCATIMLVINIILAIISFIYMLLFIWRALSASTQYIAERGYLPGGKLVYKEQSPPLQPVYSIPVQPVEYNTAATQPPQVIRTTGF